MHKFCARAIIDNYIVQKISRCGAGSKEIFNDEVTTIVTDIIPEISFLFLSSELQEYAGNAAAFPDFETAHIEKTHGSQLTAHSSSMHYSRGLLPANPKSE